MSQSLESMTTRPVKGDLQIKVKNFEVGRLAWITQVNSTSSQASLKMEKLFQAVIKERDVTTEEESERCWFCRWMKRAMSQGMWEASRSW